MKNDQTPQAVQNELIQLTNSPNAAPSILSTPQSKFAFPGHAARAELIDLFVAHLAPAKRSVPTCWLKCVAEAVLGEACDAWVWVPQRGLEAALQRAGYDTSRGVVRASLSWRRMPSVCGGGRSLALPISLTTRAHEIINDIMPIPKYPVSLGPP